ncbi:forkhead box protein I2-like [Paramacrobiotus metropolitanus]|uniref:forkhead box protein I2-like n=1 Tax=Paramacrobiotus metropolitanus TaxID=2943436 RepID=UPI0024455FEF|nr:forkhead box protein I2-like [Paramacrobiotus metropolitanus]
MDLSKMSQPSSALAHGFNLPASQSRFTGSSPVLPTAALISMQDYSQQLRVQQMYAAAEIARYRNLQLLPSAPSGLPGASPASNLPIHFPAFPYNPLPGYGTFPAGYPRTLMSRFMLREEQPKPTYSYIGLIGMAILSTPERRMILSDIYQWILDHYPYFRTRAPGWKNSIRHNLSLNACFVKCARSATGKGHYWAIHPANIKDFERGDFRRRKAQQKVHRMMGMVVPDEDDEDDSPCPSITDEKPDGDASNPSLCQTPYRSLTIAPEETSQKERSSAPRNRKCFDVESLLAPDCGRHQKLKIMDCENSYVDAETSTSEEKPQHCQETNTAKANSHKHPQHAVHTNGKLCTESRFPPADQFVSTPAEHHFPDAMHRPECRELSTADTTSQKWKESYARIIARSYCNTKSAPSAVVIKEVAD